MSPPTDPHSSPHDPAFQVGALVAAYRGMVPWLLATWLVASFLPGPGEQQVLLVAGISPFLVGAAARGMGLHPDRSTPALAVERAFTHLTSLLPLLFFVAFAAAVGGTVGAMMADTLGLHDPRITSLPLAALAALPILWRHWPAALLAYIAPEEAGYRRPGGRAWRGPRYGDARRLLRAAGDPTRTAVLVTLLLIWIAALAVVRDYGGDPTVSFVATGASYLLFLPLLVAMGATETRRMVASFHGS
jgi:hypothetical protein